jgi:hypothetical protein
MRWLNDFFRQLEGESEAAPEIESAGTWKRRLDAVDTELERLGI